MSRPLIGFVAVAALAIASPTWAQPGMPPPGPPPQGYGQPPSPAEQSDHLRQSLSLRPDQETSLQTFVAAMQPKPGEVDAAREEAQRVASLPTPQRLDATVARFDRMRAELMARIAATRAFYAQLTPAQQRAFDEMPAPR